MKNKYLLLILSIALAIFLWYIYDFIPANIKGVAIYNKTFEFHKYGFQCNPFSWNYQCGMFMILFQEIFQFFSNNISMYFLLNAFLFTFSCMFLTKEFYKLTHNIILSVILFLSIYLNPKLVNHLFYDSKYSIAIPLLMLIATLVMRFTYKKTLMNIVLISFSIGLIIIIRADFYALLPLLFIILFIYWKEFVNVSKIKVLSSFFLPFILVLLADSCLYHYNNPQQRETVLGIVLLGKIPLIAINKPKNSKYPKLSDLVFLRGKEVRDIVNKPYEFSHRQHLRTFFNIRYQDSLMVGDKIGEQINFYGKLYGNRDTILKNLFIEYAQANILQTIKIISLEFIGFWTMPQLLPKGDLIELSLLFKDYDFEYKHNKSIINHTNNINRAAVKISSVIKVTMIILLLTTITLLIYGAKGVIYSLKNKHPVLSAHFLAFIFPVMLNGYFLLMAIVNSARFRYVIVNWPILMLILFLTISILSERITKSK